MSINRFMGPVKDIYKETFVDQYVPLPFELMQKQIENKQKRFDTAENNWDVMQNKMGEQLLEADNQLMIDKVNSIREGVEASLKDAGGDFGAVSRNISNSGADYNAFMTTGQGGEGKRQLAKNTSETEKINSSNMSGEDKADSLEGMQSRYRRAGGVAGGAQIENALTYNLTGMVKELNTIIKDTSTEDSSDPKATITSDGYIVTSTDDTKELSEERVTELMSLMKGNPEFKSYVSVKWQNALEKDKLPEGIETKEEYEEFLFGSMFGGFDAKAFVKNKKTEKITEDGVQSANNAAAAKLKIAEAAKVKDMGINVSSNFSQKISYQGADQYLDKDKEVVDDPLEVLIKSQNEAGHALADMGYASFKEAYEGVKDEDVKQDFDIKLKSVMAKIGIEQPATGDAIKDDAYNLFTQYAATTDPNYDDAAADAVLTLFNGDVKKAKQFRIQAKAAYKKMQNRQALSKELDNELIEGGFLKKGNSSQAKDINKEIRKTYAIARSKDQQYLYDVKAYMAKNPHKSISYSDWKLKVDDADVQQAIQEQLYDGEQTLFNNDQWIKIGETTDESKANGILVEIRKFNKWDKGRQETYKSLSDEQKSEIDSYVIDKKEHERLQSISKIPTKENAAKMKLLRDKYKGLNNITERMEMVRSQELSTAISMPKYTWGTSVHGYKLNIDDKSTPNRRWQGEGFQKMCRAKVARDKAVRAKKAIKNSTYYKDKKNEILKNRLKTKSIDIPTQTNMRFQRKQTDGSFVEKEVNAVELINDTNTGLNAKLRTFKVKDTENNKSQSIMDYVKSQVPTTSGGNKKLTQPQHNKAIQDRFDAIMTTAVFTSVRNPDSNMMEMILSDGDKKFRVPVAFGSEGGPKFIGIGSGGTMKITKEQKTQIGLVEDIYKARLNNLKNTPVGDTDYGVSIRTNKSGLDGSLTNFADKLANGKDYSVEIDLEKIGVYLEGRDGRRVNDIQLDSKNSVNFLQTYKAILAGNATTELIQRLGLGLESTAINPKSEIGRKKIAKIFIKRQIEQAYDSKPKFRGPGVVNNGSNNIPGTGKTINDFVNLTNNPTERRRISGFRHGRNNKYEDGLNNAQQSMYPDPTEEETFNYGQKKQAENLTNNRVLTEEVDNQAAPVPEMITESTIIEPEKTEELYDVNEYNSASMSKQSNDAVEEYMENSRLKNQEALQEQQANLVPSVMTAESITDVPSNETSVFNEDKIDNTKPDLNNIPSATEIQKSKELDVSNVSQNSWVNTFNSIKNEPLKKKIISESADKLVNVPAEDATSTLEVVKSDDIGLEQTAQIIKTELLNGKAKLDLGVELISEGIKGFVKKMSDYGNQKDNPITYAASFLGHNERDKTHQDTIFNFLTEAVGKGEKFKTADSVTRTAWCAAFMNHTLLANNFDQVQMEGDGNDPYMKIRARDYQNLGEEVDYNPDSWSDSTQVGDIVVIKNKKGQYHVAYNAGTNEEGSLRLLGGNQRNKVSVIEFNPATHEMVSMRRLKNVKSMDIKQMEKIIKTSKDGGVYYKNATTR